MSSQTLLPEKRLRLAIELAEALRVETDGSEGAASQRVHVAGPCLCIAQEHHGSIVMLIADCRYASAFALLRSAIDAYVRGAWLTHCATEADVLLFVQDDRSPPGMDDMIGALERTDAYSGGELSRAIDRVRKALHSYTHTGGLHVQRWMAPGAIEAAYSPAEVESVLEYAEFVGLMSTIAIASLIGDEPKAQRLLDLVKRHEDAVRALTAKDDQRS